jgi:cytochrome c551/c552
VTDEDLAKVIKQGGAAVGKSQFMPPSPQLSDATIAELVKIIRSFKQ